jgi:hypothetical protein
LRGYWFRFGGGDWGLQHLAVFHKGCRNEQDGRIHIYDELSMSQTGGFEMGILLAKWWLPDLEGLPDRKITVALSPDAFNKVDASKTRAERISDGIKTILGPYGSLLMKYTHEEWEAMQKHPEYAQKLFENRVRNHPKGQMCIALKPANNSRVDGWNYLIDLLRFRPVLQEARQEIEERLRQTFNHSGSEAVERAMAKAAQASKPEVLPGLQIWSRCKLAIQFLTEAQHNEEDSGKDIEDVAKVNKNYDDAGESLRYTLMNYKEVEAQMPKSYWVGEKLEEFQADYIEDYGEPLTDPSRLMMVQRTQNAMFDKQHKGGGGRLTFKRNCQIHR